MTALFIMDSLGWIHAHGDWRSLFGTWEVSHLTKPNQLFQDRLINTCFPARRLDFTAHKTVSSMNINQQENRQPERFWLGMAWLSLLDGRWRHFQGTPASRRSAEAWFPPPSMCKPPVRFLLRSEESAWLAKPSAMTSCVMSCLKSAFRSKPRAILWVGCTTQTYQQPHDHEMALKANSCLI